MDGASDCTWAICDCDCLASGGSDSLVAVNEGGCFRAYSGVCIFVSSGYFQVLVGSVLFFCMCHFELEILADLSSMIVGLISHL